LSAREALNAHDSAKRSFYSAVNGVPGKVLNIASEDIIQQLIVSKYMPILLTAVLEALYIRQICTH